MHSEIKTIQWLLEGDPSIVYQTKRDLLGTTDYEIQKKIKKEGWGKKYLDARNKNGHWGQKFYQPKWTSTHYTLLDLRTLEIERNCPAAREALQLIFENEKAPDGGINPAGSIAQSDVCINGMLLNYASYFQAEEKELCSVVDFVLSQTLADGGYNCRLNRSGAHHSSMHSTLSVLEGMGEYLLSGYRYRKNEVEKAMKRAIEFLLVHHLYLSDRTGKVNRQEFTRLSFPGRWKYNILRAMDCFQHLNLPADSRMKEAIEVLLGKRRKDGKWNVQAHHPGQVHFIMEPAGRASRWNTLRALRVLKHYDFPSYDALC